MRRSTKWTNHAQRAGLRPLGGLAGLGPQPGSHLARPRTPCHMHGANPAGRESEPFQSSPRPAPRAFLGVLATGGNILNNGAQRQTQTGKGARSHIPELPLRAANISEDTRAGRQGERQAGRGRHKAEEGYTGSQGFLRPNLRTWQKRHWKLYFSFRSVYLSLIIYLVLPERSLGGDFNTVKFVEMLSKKCTNFTGLPWLKGNLFY